MNTIGAVSIDVVSRFPIMATKAINIANVRRPDVITFPSSRYTEEYKSQITAAASSLRICLAGLLCGQELKLNHIHETAAVMSEGVCLVLPPNKELADPGEFPRWVIISCSPPPLPMSGFEG